MRRRRAEPADRVSQVASYAVLAACDIAVLVWAISVVPRLVLPVLGVTTMVVVLWLVSWLIAALSDGRVPLKSRRR